MTEEGRVLSTRQIILLILGFTIGGGILVLPKSVAKILDASGWFLLLGAGALFIIGAWLTARLAQLFPEETVIEFSRRLFGKTLGFITGMLFTLFFFFFIPLELSILQEVVNISILDGAPSWFVSGSALLMMAFAASRDIDHLAMVNEILIEVAITVGLFVDILAWQHFDPLHLLPLVSVERMNPEAFQKELGSILFFAGYPLVAMILPFVKKPQTACKATVWAMVLVLLLNTFFIITVFGVFGYKETINLAWSGLELAKSVTIEAVILERLDLVLIISWLSAIFTTGALAYFFTVSGLSRLLGVRNPAPITWALAPVIYYISASQLNYFVWQNKGFFLIIFVLLVGMILPLLMYLVAKIRVRQGRRG